jgi:hypothetical protein
MGNVFQVLVGKKQEDYIEDTGVDRRLIYG